jgi:hypothetical protein
LKSRYNIIGITEIEDLPHSDQAVEVIVGERGIGKKNSF